MPGYNTQFELTVDDIELIEDALQLRKSDLSLKRLELLNDAQADTQALDNIDATLSETHDLLGRLHNQKVFYRPSSAKAAPYVGG